MSLDETHPKYTEFAKRWTLCRDAQEGQEQVKGKGITYLPPTRGMELDGMNPAELGYRRYQAFKQRALFPEVFADTVNILVGTMNRQPATIQLPKAMEDMRDKATILGESLDDVLRKVHEQQLVTGRVGLHLDVPMEEVRRANMLPLLSIFDAEAIINWDDGKVMDPTKQSLNLVVLDVSEDERDGFTWTEQTKYRVLQLGDLHDNEATGTYLNGIFREAEGYNLAGMTEPTLSGKKLDQIPFVFIGPRDINIMPDLPPLLGLANRCFAIYAGEADLRNALHGSSEETLVTIGNMMSGEDDGDDDSIRVGTGARIAMAEGGDAKFIGPESRALQYQENNVKRDYEAANALSARLSQQGSQVESGDALRIRVAAQTANLASIARSAASGLEELLRIAAVWIGANPDEVKIEANLNFADDPQPFEELNGMLTFKQRGGVISHRTMNDIMVKRDMTTRSLEEELEAIQEEQGLIPAEIADAFAMASMGDAGAPFENDGEDDDEPGGGDDDDDENGRTAAGAA